MRKILHAVVRGRRTNNFPRKKDGKMDDGSYRRVCVRVCARVCVPFCVKAAMGLACEGTNHKESEEEEEAVLLSISTMEKKNESL